MRGRILLFVAMTTAAVARSQVAPSATGGSDASESPMAPPPPVSGLNYPTEVGSEGRTNYLRGGFTSTTAYVNNFYPGSGGAPVAETTESVLSTFSYDATTARHHLLVTYSPGYTFYWPSSALNEFDNSVRVAYNLRLTPHTTMSASDSFEDSSLPFNPIGAETDATVSGSPVSSTPGVIPPFAKMLTNSGNLELSAQTGRNVMVGVSGLASELHYPNQNQATGLFDSNSRGGTAFYNRRLTATQYFGLDYQYLDMLATPPGGTSTTQTHTISGYYTLEPKPGLSMSVSGGPQYYQVVETPLPATGSWDPSVSASMGWQGIRTSLAASYSQSVTGGGGLLGAFHTKSANATARWQMARTWTTSASGAYSILKPVSSLFMSGEPGGHTVSGTAALEHSFGSQLSIAFNYSHIHESFDGIAAIAIDPDSDREAVSIVWHFDRSLGK
jgi:hypothetical protein